MKYSDEDVERMARAGHEARRMGAGAPFACHREGAIRDVLTVLSAGQAWSEFAAAVLACAATIAAEKAATRAHATDADRVAEVLDEQAAYSVKLQRLIEAACSGRELPYPELHHRRMLATFLSSRAPAPSPLAERLADLLDQFESNRRSWLRLDGTPGEVTAAARAETWGYAADGARALLAEYDAPRAPVAGTPAAPLDDGLGWLREELATAEREVAERKVAADKDRANTVNGHDGWCDIGRGVGAYCTCGTSQSDYERAVEIVEEKRIALAEAMAAVTPPPTAPTEAPRELTEADERQCDAAAAAACAGLEAGVLRAATWTQAWDEMAAALRSPAPQSKETP